MCTINGTDGIRVIGEESCDDGNEDEDDGCYNNQVETYWFCEEDANLLSTCVYNPCGNEIVEEETPYEE